MQRRVVITGMGTLNAIGSNTKEFWSALMYDSTTVVYVSDNKVVQADIYTKAVDRKKKQ